MNRLSPRERTAKRIRSKIARQRKNRLTVTKTAKHICAQIFNYSGSEVLASASSKEKVIREQNFENQGKIGIAKAVGKLIAERAKEKNIVDVAFDRSGYIYHGRIKALADSAREDELNF